MNMTKKGFLYLIASMAAVLTISCQKDDTIQYNNSTMGNVIDERFVSDQGNIFNIVDQVCPGKLDTMDRAFVICDVLSKTSGGADNEYDVRLKQISPVLTKDAVHHTNTTEAMLIQDPIFIEYAWVSGGYLNMFIVYPCKVDSKTRHMINLVHEGGMINPETKEEISGTYRFTLRHNADGDKITQPQTSEYVFAGGYVSFPLNSYISETEAEFCIEWPWHKNVGGGLSSETEVKSLCGKYVSTGFQHAPKTFSAQITAIVE